MINPAPLPLAGLAITTATAAWLLSATLGQHLLWMTQVLLASSVQSWQAASLGPPLSQHAQQTINGGVTDVHGHLV